MDMYVKNQAPPPLGLFITLTYFLESNDAILDFSVPKYNSSIALSWGLAIGHSSEVN